MPESSITIDQPPPYKMAMNGMTFTSVYPAEARSGGRTPQYEYHPRLQFNFSQNGKEVTNFSTDPEGAGHRRNADGTITGFSKPLREVSIGWPDPTQPASCMLTLWNPIHKQGQTVYTTYASITLDLVP